MTDASQLAVKPSFLKDTLHFDILGLRVQVQCACMRTQQKIAAYLYAHAKDPRERSPDLMVRLFEPLEEDRFRYLFRTQPKGAVQDLGAWVLYENSDGWQHWTRTQPVLVPFALPVLKDRFMALHAAAVVAPGSRQATVLMGSKGAGKTTVSMRLAQDFGWPLLTDETTAIETFSHQCWPLVRPPHITISNPTGGLAKAHMEIEEFSNVRVATGPTQVNRLVELTHAPGLQEPHVEPLTSSQAHACDGVSTYAVIWHLQGCRFPRGNRIASHCKDVPDHAWRL